MKLEDVKIDGKTEYFCSRGGCTVRCVIIGSHVNDGAFLIANAIESKAIWGTEACYLQRVEE